MHEKYDPTDLITSPTFNPDLSIIEYAPEKQILSFGKGTAAWCFSSIIMSNDLVAAREKIREVE